MRAYGMRDWPTCRSATCTACCVLRSRRRCGGVGCRATWRHWPSCRSRKVAPRGVMSAADVRHVIAVGDAIGSEVGLMLRLAAVTGARRAELAALQWTDVVDGVLTVDSAIEIDRRSGRTVLSDAPTKTANQRRITLDAATLAVVERERASLEEYGPWMFNVGRRATEPGPHRLLVAARP